MIEAQFDWTKLFNKKYIMYMHFLLWSVVFSCFIIFDEYPERLKGIELVCILLQQTLQIAIPCYTQVYLVWPFFSAKKFLPGGILYIVQILLLIFCLPYILNGVGILFVKLFNITDTVDWTQEQIAFTIIAFTVFATAFKIALDKLILDKEQKESELKHLKAQLNPHFLFNTLNNLYGLSIDQSKKLPEMMLKLSDLLRYSLYDTNQTYVPLRKELDYIGNYIELEKIRLDERTRIRFEVEGDITNQSISPLMLIAFIENAFKHYSSTGDENAFILINFKFQGHLLKMTAQNSLDSAYSEKVYRGTHTGIGLNNVRQRLDLLYYKKYTLVESRLESSYTVTLDMDLTR